MTRLAGTSMPDELARSAARMPGRGFDDADVGALAYLDHLLNDTIRPSYRHVVVDEAQDISPIEFKLLAASSLNNWFTVLGDTAQRADALPGNQRLEGDRAGVRAVGDRGAARSQVLQVQRQITLFNNRILRAFDRNIPAPIPFEREGHR